MPTSPVVRQSHVQRVVDYLQQKSLDVPTPEECRKHFTPDDVGDALQDLQNNGFCVIQDWFNLPADNSGVLKPMDEETIFQKFDLAKGIGGIEFEPNRLSGKRVQTTKKHSNQLLAWGNVREQLDSFFKHFWPDCSLEYQATRLCSKRKAPAQAVHCDNTNEGYYTGYHGFPVDVMIPISFRDDTFLDIRPSGNNKNIRVLLRRGDLLVFRGDVAHRGVENDSKKPHYRLHVYVDHKLKSRRAKPSDSIAVRREKDRTYYVHVGFS